MENLDHEERGLTGFGSRTRQIVSSPDHLVSALKRSFLNSETTGARSLVPTPQSSIGQRRSATDAVSLPSIADAMALADPELTDRAILASLPLSIRSAFSPVKREFVDPEYGYDFEVTGYQMQAGEFTSDELSAACELVNAALIRTVDVPGIKIELARLRASTKARAESDGDLAMTMQVLAEECAQWPIDVVRGALRKWARREVFFPSLAELTNELQRAGRNRRRIAEALASAAPRVSAQ